MSNQDLRDLPVALAGLLFAMFLLIGLLSAIDRFGVVGAATLLLAPVLVACLMWPEQ
jgi:hypothetical protein